MNLDGQLAPFPGQDTIVTVTNNERMKLRPHQMCQITL